MLKQAGIGLVSASLMLAGCDSGSNSSSSSSLTYNGPTAPVAISEGNANTVAGFAASESTSTATQSNLMIAGVSASSSETGSEPTSLTILDQLEKYTDMAQTADLTDSAVLTGVASTQTACGGGGTVTSTFNYSDPTLSQPYSGDSYSLSYANCLETDPDTGITSQTNGTVSGLYNNYSYTDPFTYDMSINYSYGNLKVTNLANGNYLWLDGALRADMSRTGQNTGIQNSSLSGSAIVSETNTAGVAKQVSMTNFSFSHTLDISTLQSNFDNDFTVASAEIGGSITVLTVNPFVVDYYTSANPISGQLIVTGADNAKVRLTAQPDATNAYLEYDIAPIDGIYETNATIPWANL